MTLAMNLINSPLINPEQILDSYRKSDAVFIVCQNTKKQIIEIAAINQEAEKITGYRNEDLLNKDISTILPDRIAAIVHEFVEYEDGNDLMHVLGKISDFAIKSKSGEEIGFKLRIIRGDAFAGNPWFHLVMVNDKQEKTDNLFRSVLKENFKGHETIDQFTGLPDRDSLLKDLELVVYHVRSKNISASFAVIDINRYSSLLSEYGQQNCDKIHKHIGEICKMKLRPEDTICTLSDRSLGIIMIDTSQEVARMVLNRLRWAISVTPMQIKAEEVSSQVNISFTQIDGKVMHAELLAKCEDYMNSQRVQVNNSVQLVIAYERRTEAEDRRNAKLPVEPNLRVRPRRKPKK